MPVTSTAESGEDPRRSFWIGAGRIFGNFGYQEASGVQAYFFTPTNWNSFLYSFNFCYYFLHLCILHLVHKFGRVSRLDSRSSVISSAAMATADVVSLDS